MESPAPAQGPCVYVPISHPDSPVPTYAVLQVLGVSPAPDPSLHFSPASAPRLRLRPAPAPAHKRCASSAESANSSSSSSDERDRHLLTAIRPAPMKKTAGLAPPGLSSPAARRSGKLLPFRGTISITHTDKDTIIHAAPSDFRKVVHELTGAASGSKGLKPISLPSRMMQAGRNDRDPALPSPTAQAMAMPSVGQDNGGGGEAMESAIAGRPADGPAPNLLERRKSSKVLARLLTSGKSPPSPLVPSPDTPLSFDFEKIGLPTTPSSSEGRLTPGVSMSPLFHGTRAMEALSLSGGHANGSMPDLPRSYSVKDPSMEVRPCDPDAIAPEMSELSRCPGLSLRLIGEDVPLASPVRRMQDMQSSNKHVMRDADGLSLALAPAAGAARLANTADAPSAEEPHALDDAMDVETPCDDAGTDDPGTALKESCLADDDESSVIAKKGFFFHSERPQHGDPTLLALFPESSKDS